LAFVPLLWLEQQGIRRSKFFGWVYLTMLTWNAATTWWIWNASAPGALGAIFANSLLMCLPWIGFHFIKARFGSKIGYPALVALWLAFEFFHLHDWGLSWPWLTLGNVFANHPGWVQWYSFTGASGGSLWILTMNISVFLLISKNSFRTLPTVPLSRTLGIFSAPLLLSSIVAPAKDQPQPPGTSNVVIIQPNIDPYEKVSDNAGSFDAMLGKLIRLSDSAIDNNTTLVVWPETAVFMANGINEDKMKSNFFLNPLWDFLRRHPKINLLTGVESYRAYRAGSQSSTARPVPNTNMYEDDYNAAVLMDSTGPLHFYHKTMLVPGVETLPFFLHFLDPLFEKFGGTTAGYTGQPDRTPMTTSNHSYTIAPAVCYESIYGEFMSRYIHNGADLIAIITNDGWWGNTPGYHQHEAYARLRAIETRHWVVRSANTGVSCIIDPSGHIVESRPWDQASFIKAYVPATHEETFYVKYIDIVSWLAVIATILLVIGTPMSIIKNKRRG
ncbi:MAG TPA: apolipoprotein N-acyltransferase, partial [Puia sp.]|nr:apolipoprotein N-acyltransferase [Puia sp.]